MTPADLRAVDDLCRLVRTAQRLGCTVRLEGVDDELRSLLDLAGVADLVLGWSSSPDENPHTLPNPGTERPDR